MPKTRVRIGLTMGDPVGIGPEICAKAMHALKDSPGLELVLLGDSKLLAGEIRKLKLKLKIFELSNASASLKPGYANVLNLSGLRHRETICGKPTRETARASLTYIDHAIRLSGEKIIDGVVTGPINKNAIFKIYEGFKGHTEYIARKTSSPCPVMMMVSPKMKVIPVTTHTAIAKVPGEISINVIVATARIANENLKKFFGIAEPRIGICGLNPHSGEEIFGNEESDIIYPAVKIARSIGIDANGPYPADSIFLKALDKTYDLIITMYHDQALIPIKTLSFHKVVNVTLGIPVIRTSVGHGVAYDIAGKGKASHESMLAAVKLAGSMARKAKE